MNQKKSNSLNIIYDQLQYLILDTRSLSIFRIALGISLLYNILFIKWGFIVHILGADTFMVFTEIQAIGTKPNYSIFSFIRSNLFVNIYMWLYLVNTILFILGFKTRVTSILSVFFQFNIFQAANIFAFGFDMFTFQLSFWAMFLPLSNYYSIERNRCRDALPSLSISIVLLIQIGMIYLFTGIFKYGVSWQDGYAVKLMLLDDDLMRGIGPILLKNKWLYTFSTYFTLLGEYLLIGLILIKWNWKKLRLIGAIFLFSFHSLIFLSYDAGNFSLSGFAVALLLVPGDFWRQLKWKTNDVKEIVKFANKIKWVYISLSLVAIFVIVERNFYNYYLYNDDKVTVNRLKKIHVPSVATASFFTQYWRMFSPNPAKHVGWLELAKNEVNDIGMSSLKSIYSSKEKNPADWEAFILSHMKRNLYKKNTQNVFTTSLVNWLKWKIIDIDGSSANQDDYYLIEHRKMIEYETGELMPESYLVYSVADLANGIIRPLQ